MDRREGTIIAEMEAEIQETLPIRVVLLDDQQLVREGLRQLLAAHGDIRVVGETATPDRALLLCRGLRPDVLLADIPLTGMSEFALVRRVKECCPETRVIVLPDCDGLRCGSSYAGAPAAAGCRLAATGRGAHPDCLALALAAGARGVLPKTSPGIDLVRAVRTVARGGHWIEEELTERLVGRLQDVSQSPANALMHEGLTRREVEVIRELLAGYSNKEIGRVLGISEQTVKNVISRALDRLHLQDRVQVALYAVETRLLDRYAALLV